MHPFSTDLCCSPSHLDPRRGRNPNSPLSSPKIQLLPTPKPKPCPPEPSLKQSPPQVPAPKMPHAWLFIKPGATGTRPWAPHTMTSGLFPHLSISMAGKGSTSSSTSHRHPSGAHKAHRAQPRLTGTRGSTWRRAAVGKHSRGDQHPGTSHIDLGVQTFQGPPTTHRR